MRCRALAPAVCIGLAIALTACGGADDAPASLSRTQLEDAMVGLDELGDDFRVDVDEDDDDDDSGFGCLEDADDIGGDEKEDEPVREAEAAYEADSELALPGVFSFAASLPSTAVAQRGFRAMREVLATCTEIDETDEDGAITRMKVEHDDERSGPGADDQLNMSAIGTLEIDGIRVPMSFHLTMIRIANHVTMTALVTVGHDAADDADELAEAALARFAAVVDGKRVPRRPVDLDPVDESLFERVEESGSI